MYGLFIKRERLAQNMSQEALCHGICAVSYLSKIENGKVQPNHEIILKLMSALNMVFPETQEETDHIQKELENLLDLAETGNEGFQSAYERLKELSGSLMYFPTGLLVEGFSLLNQNDNDRLTHHMEMLSEYAPHWTREQQLRFDLFSGWSALRFNRSQEAVTHFRQAQGLENNEMALSGLTAAYYVQGDYRTAIEIGKDAFIKQMEAGNIQRGIDVSFTVAAAYANQNRIEEALKIYRRILNMLGDGDGFEFKYSVYYNLGASYLMEGQFEASYRYLSQALDLAETQLTKSGIERLLLYQKLALVAIGQGHIDFARGWITSGLDILEAVDCREKIQTHESIESCPESLILSFEWLKFYLYEEDPRSNPDFLKQLEKTYRQSVEDSHFGFRLMYGSYLIEVLSAQRRYKEALQISQEIEISWKTKLSTI